MLDQDPSEDLRNDLIQLVGKEIGAIAKPDIIQWAPGLPKTRSGKILRSTMVKVANSESFKVPATIDDKAILDEIHAALSHYGYAKTKNF